MLRFFALQVFRLRRCRNFLIALLLVLITFGFGFFCLNVIYRSSSVFEKFRSDFFTKLEKEHNFTISYTRIGIRFFRYYELRNFTIEREKESIKIGILRIHFSPWKFLFRFRFSDVVRWIEIRDTDINLLHEKNPEKINDLDAIFFGKVLVFKKIKEKGSQLLDSLKEFSSQSNALPNIRIEARRLNINVQTSAFAFKTGNIHLSFLSTRNGVKFDLVTELEFPRRLMPWALLQMTLKARIDLESKEGDIFCNFFPSLYRNNKIFKRNIVKFRASWKDEIWEFAKLEDNLPFDIGMRLNTKERYIHFDFHANNFDIVDYFNFQSASSTDQVARSNWNGRADILYFPDDGILSYVLIGEFKTFIHGDDSVLLDVDLVGNNIDMQVKKFGLSSSEFDASYKGTWNIKNFFPTGRFTFKKLLNNNQSLELILNSKEIEDKVFIKTQTLLLNGMSIGDMRITVENNDKDYYGHFIYGIGKENIISFRADYLDSIDFFQWNLKSQNFRFLEFVKAQVLPEFFTNSSLEIDIFGKLESGNLFIDAKRFDFLHNENPVLSSAFMLENGVFHLSNLMLRWGNFFTRFTLRSKLYSSEIEGFLNIPNAQYQICGNYSKEFVKFYGKNGEFIINFFQKRFLLNIDNLSLKNPHRQDNRELSVFSQGSWIKEFKVFVSQFSIVGGDIKFFFRDLEIGRNDGKIESISYEDLHSRITGYMGYQSYIRQEKWQLDGVMELTGRDGESYHLHVYHDDYWRGDMMMTRFPLERLNIASLEGFLSTDIGFTIKEWRPKIDITAFSEGFYNNLRGVFDFGCSIGEKGVQVLGNRVQYGKWKLNGPVLLADFETGKVDFSSRMTNVKENIKTGLSVALTPEIYQGISSFGSILKSNFSLLMQTESWTMYDRTFLPPYLFALIRENDNLYLRSHDEDLILDCLYNFVEGTFSLDFEDKITLIRGKSHGDFSPGEFYLAIDHISGPLMFFNPLLFIPPLDSSSSNSEKRILGFPRGKFAGNFFIGSDHLIHGELDISGQIKSPFSPRTTVKLDNKIIINNNIIKVDKWTFHLHDKTFLTINASLHLGNNFPYQIRVDIPEGRGVAFNFDLLEYVKFNGRVLGWSQYEGDLRGGYLSGRLECPTGQGSLASLTKYISKKEVREKPIVYKVLPIPYNIVAGSRVNSQQYSEAGDKFDLVHLKERDDLKVDNRELTDYFTIVIGKDVTFYVPSKSFSTIEARINPGEFVDVFFDISLPETVNYMYLEGALRINRGEINYFGKQFVIERDQAIIFFNEENALNPYLDLKANYRTHSRSGRTISMHLKSYVLDAFDPEFSSQEGLSQEQIRTLLGDNFSVNEKNESAWVSPVGLDRGLGNSFWSSNTDPLRREIVDPKLMIYEQLIRTGTASLGGGVSRMVESIVRVVPFIDTVIVKTDFISNFALEKFYETYPHKAYNRFFSLAPDHRKGNDFAHYFDGTSINFGSYITKDFTFRANVDLEGKSNLSRYIDASQLNFNVYFNFEINTPFFLVDWSFNPMQNDTMVGISKWKFKPEVTMTLSRSFVFSDWGDLYRQLKSNFGKTKF